MTLSNDFCPVFDSNGLIPVITTDYLSGEVLMQAYMNQDALAKTLACGEAVYYSRSRQALWHKGQTSGHVQIIKDIRVDCDQDCLWLQVDVQGKGSCHVGYRSCFYRSVPFGPSASSCLTATDVPKLFDPNTVYGHD